MTGARKRLVLHCGIHRTGTTALQQFMANSRSELRNQGILYPFTDRSHVKIAYALKRAKMAKNELAKLLESESKADTHTIVMSSEDFSIHKNLDWVAYLGDFYDVHAIFTLRRQDDWLNSWYNQHIRWPFDRKLSQTTPEEFLTHISDFHWIDYNELTQRWLALLPMERVHVCIYKEGPQALDVMKALGLPVQGAKAENVNASCPAELLSGLRLLNLFPEPPAVRKLAIQELMSLTEANGYHLTYVYSPEQRRNILRHFEESNAQVCKRHFTDRPTLFQAPDEDDYYSEPDQNVVVQRQIIPVLMKMFRRQTKRAEE